MSEIRQETREELRARVRREVAEEIAAAIEGEQDLMDSLPVNDPGVNQQARLTIPARSSAFRDAAKIARDLGGRS